MSIDNGAMAGVSLCAEGLGTCEDQMARACDTASAAQVEENGRIEIILMCSRRLPRC